MLRALGAVPVVIGVRDADTDKDRWRFGEVEMHLADQTGPAALAFAPQLNEALAEARLDLLHLHGIWQYPSHPAGEWAAVSGKPFIVSPHGMLDPWITRRNAWKKHLARALWERGSWRTASAFHALTGAEASDIEHETRSARIATIPNPAPPLAPIDDTPRGPNILYLGRIHEKKNIPALVAGWLTARPQLPDDATLTIAGWGDDEGIEALESAMKAHAGTGIEFVGTAFGSQKAALFDLSRFLVLPSFSEGLPMAVLEAWSAGVPTIMTDHCHLPEGFAAGAALRCGTEKESIRDALIAAFAMPEERWQDMAQAARDLAAGPFAPSRVALDWEAFYAGLLEG